MIPLHRTESSGDVSLTEYISFPVASVLKSFCKIREDTVQHDCKVQDVQ